MSRSYELVVGVENDLVVVVQETLSLLVDIGSEEALRPSNRHAVGALSPFAASSLRAEEVVMAVALVDVGSLHEVARHALRLCPLLELQSVVGQLCSVDAVEAAPEEVFPSAVLDIEGVDTVLNVDFLADEQLAVIGERTFRSVGCCHTDAAFPFAAPGRHGVVHHVASVYVVDVRSPDAAFLDEVGACLVSEGCAEECPVHQVVRPIDGQVACALRGIEVEVPVGRFDNGGVG